MRRFKQFLTEARVYQEKYITQETILPLHPNPTGGDALVGAISLLDGFSSSDKFVVISKETFENVQGLKHKIEIPEGNTSNPLHVRQSNNEYYIKITGKSKTDIQNAFYGGTSAGGLSGTEGELFWEYVSWLGVTDGSLDDLLEPTDDHLKAVSKIDSDKLTTVIKSSANFIKYIFGNSQELRNKVSSKVPTVYARWDGLLIDNYYAYMKNNAKNYVRPNLKDNVADAVWIWGNDFIASGKTGLHFIPTPGLEDGLIDVWETPGKGKPIAKMLQVSLKKGKSEAQGGGTTDALKGMGVFDSGMKSQLQARAKAENIHIGVIDEGVLDYVKVGLQKAKNIFAKLFGYFDGLVKRVISAFEGKGKRQFFKFAKRAGIDKSMLTEGFLPERFEGISGHVIENDFTQLLNKVTSAVSDNVFTVVWGDGSFGNSAKGIVVPDGSWFSQREKESSTDQQAALNYILINEVALWVIGNIASRSKSMKPSELVGEMADFIWDIKMGDTELPVVQLYGDASKWDVLDRGKSDKAIEDINNYMENLEGLTFYPIVANVFAQKNGKPWNVTHLYIIKSMTTDSDVPEPVYFKMVLRGDGSTPKINSENDYYRWIVSESKFVKYKG